MDIIIKVWDDAISKNLRGVDKPENEFEFVDPLDLYEKIQALESDIDGFKSNVDTVLVLSNATTFIETGF